MLGMLQILIWIGVVIVILLGVIVLQIGFAADEKAKGWAYVIGCVVAALAIVAAAFFMMVSAEQTALISDVGRGPPFIAG